MGECVGKWVSEDKHYLQYIIICSRWCVVTFTVVIAASFKKININESFIKRNLLIYKSNFEICFILFFQTKTSIQNTIRIEKIEQNQLQAKKNENEVEKWEVGLTVHDIDIYWFISILDQPQNCYIIIVVILFW